MMIVETLVIDANGHQHMETQELPDDWYGTPMTQSEKRRIAYTTGEVDGTDWHIAWMGEQYTVDALTQLGVQYRFRGEDTTADEIETAVSAKVGEIRAAYPDENAEVIEA